MDLYTNPLSPNCRKVEAVAKQLDLDLNRKLIDVRKGEHRTPAFLSLNANGKIPVLVDGDVTLWESNAIQCYLAAKVDTELWPKNNLRYDIMRWQAWELAHLGAAARQLTFQRVLKPLFGIGHPDPARCEEEEGHFRRYAKVLDDHLAGKRFLVANHLTIADFCVASTLAYAEPANLPLAEFQNVRRWLGRLDEEPGWRASVPPPM